VYVGYLGKPYSHADRDYEANGRSNDLTMTWVLIAICGLVVSKGMNVQLANYLRAALDAQRKRNEVAHVDKRRMTETLRVDSLVWKYEMQCCKLRGCSGQ